MYAPDITKIQAEFKKYLAQNGFSYTPQRQLILAAIYKNRSHFDVEELIRQIQEGELRVGRATVYRTIAHLENLGYLRKIDFDQDHAHYEFVVGHEHHEHLICKQCGKVIEFTDSKLEKRLDEILARENFTMTKHAVQIFGMCHECRDDAIT